MPNTLTLLALTADLHAASREPRRWPEAWTALCRWIGCPAVFGAGDASAMDQAGLTIAIAARSAEARRCAENGGGRCGQSGKEKCYFCPALVEHLDHALGNSGPAACSGLPDAYLAALDTLPVPMILCRTDRQLVHANRAGMDELLRQRWLRLADDTVCAQGDGLHAQFSASFARLAATPASTAYSLVPTPQVDGNAADIGLRRLGDGEHLPFVLVTLATHTAEHSAEQLAGLGERRQLPPRQRELAGLLLAGLSLNSAAEKMGITRRTARDHLEGLFRATGTRRQQDLIVRLSRDANC